MPSGVGMSSPFALGGTGGQWEKGEAADKARALAEAGSALDEAGDVWEDRFTRHDHSRFYRRSTAAPFVERGRCVSGLWERGLRHGDPPDDCGEAASWLIPSGPVAARSVAKSRKATRPCAGIPRECFQGCEVGRTSAGDAVRRRIGVREG